MAIDSVIDTSKIEAMVAQLKAAAARAQGGVDPVQSGVAAEKPALLVISPGPSTPARAGVCLEVELEPLTGVAVLARGR